MDDCLRVLLVADADDEAELVTRELERGGYKLECERVDNRGAFREALHGGVWDAIIAECSLHAYTGLRALADAKAAGKDIPVILICDTIGEEASAIAAMRAGARDYVLRSDPARLPVAVERELRDKAAREERAKTREQLVIAERMAAAGTLAAGVAHEIRNPLSVAMTNLDFLAETLGRAVSEAGHSVNGRPPLGDWNGLKRTTMLDESLRDIREALGSIRDIVRDLQVFSAPQDDRIAPVDPRRAIDSAIRMANGEIRQRAQLIKDYRPVPLVKANESRLGQAILCLVTNSAMAIHEGKADRNELRVATRTGDDGSAIVEVSDTGPGIEKSQLEWIFDMFSAAKPVSAGDNLELTICHRIVSAIGGRIEVESENGNGRLFRLVLPAIPEGQSAAAEATTINS